MSRALAAALLTLATALAGCATIERMLPLSPAPSVAAQPAPGELMDYLAKLRGMNEARLAAEAAAQRQRAARQPDDTARLKAAMALTLVRSSDEGDILALVEPVLKNDRADRESMGVASFLQGIAVERRRLKESAGTATARLKDERRALEQQKQRADALQERAAQLQQKLDALSELEKSLSDREPTSR